MAAKTAPAPHEITCPDPSAHEDHLKSMQTASSAALLASNLSRQREDALDADGKLTSKGAASSIRYAKAQDLPGFPIVGTTPNSANTAALLAKDHKMKDLWQPEASAAGSNAATKAHKDGGYVDPIYQPSATSVGGAAAALAFRNKGVVASNGPTYSETNRTNSLAAATRSAYLGRQRAGSTPPEGRVPDANNSNRSALNAATLSVRAAPDGWNSEANQAARFGNIGNRMDKQMFGEHPPVEPEVREQQHQAALHASAVSMARSMMEYQNRSNAASDNGSNVGSAGAAETAHRRNKSSLSQADIKEEAVKYIHLQDAAHRLAQERLAKVDQDIAARNGNNYYGTSPTKKSRLSSVRTRTRNRASSDSRYFEDSDDEERARNIRSQTSQLSSGLNAVDDKKRQDDRARLQAAAQKRVTAQMHDMDEKVFLETGKPSQAMMDEWEVKAREKAEKDRVERDKHPGKTHIGGGKYMDKSEIEAIAAARLKPTLDEINDTAQKRRDRDEEIKRQADERETARMQEKIDQQHEKEEARAKAEQLRKEQQEERLRAQQVKDEERKQQEATKAEFKRIREQDKAAAKKAKEDRKAAERAQKDEARAKKQAEIDQANARREEERRKIREKEAEDRAEQERIKAAERAEQEEARLKREKAIEDARKQREAEVEAARLKKEQELEDAKLRKEKEFEEIRARKEKEIAEIQARKELELEQARAQTEVERRKTMETEANLKAEQDEARAHRDAEAEEARARNNVEVEAAKARTLEEQRKTDAAEAARRYEEEESRKQRAVEIELAKARAIEEKRKATEAEAAQKAEDDAARARMEVKIEEARARAEEERRKTMELESAQKAEREEAMQQSRDKHREEIAAVAGGATLAEVAEKVKQDKESPRTPEIKPKERRESRGVFGSIKRRFGRNSEDDKRADKAIEKPATKPEQTEKAAAVVEDGELKPDEGVVVPAPNNVEAGLGAATDIKEEHKPEKVVDAAHEGGGVPGTAYVGAGLVAAGILSAEQVEHKTPEETGRATTDDAKLEHPAVEPVSREADFAAPVAEPIPPPDEQVVERSVEEPAERPSESHEPIPDAQIAAAWLEKSSNKDVKDEDDEGDDHDKVATATALSGVGILGTIGTSAAAAVGHSDRDHEPEAEDRRSESTELSSEDEDEDEDDDVVGPLAHTTGPGEHTGHHNFAMASPGFQRGRPDLERHISTIESSDEDDSEDDDDDDGEDDYFVNRPTLGRVTTADQIPAVEKRYNDTAVAEKSQTEEQPIISRPSSKDDPAGDKTDSSVSPMSSDETGKVLVADQVASREAPTLVTVPSRQVQDEPAAPSPVVKPGPSKVKQPSSPSQKEKENKQGGLRRFFSKLKGRDHDHRDKLHKEPPKDVVAARSVKSQKSFEPDPKDIASNGKEEKVIDKDDDEITPVTTTTAGKADERGRTVEQVLASGEVKGIDTSAQPESPSSFRRHDRDLEGMDDASSSGAEEEDLERGRGGRIAQKLGLAKGKGKQRATENGEDAEKSPSEQEWMASAPGKDDQEEEARDHFDESLAPQPAFAGSAKSASPSRETKFHEDF